MKRKWFWITLIFWASFTCTVITWPLIYAPVRFDPKIIGEFETKVNGFKQKNIMWINEGNLNDLLPIILEKLTKEGWISVGKNMDLTPVLLGIADESEQPSKHLLIKVFQRKDFYKTLGLWEPVGAGKTYGFVGEIPDSIFSLSQAKTHWDLPFTPPSDSNSLYCQKLNNIDIGLISLPYQDKFGDVFHQLCVTRGFSEKLLSSETDKKIFVLTKGRIKILAISEIENGQTSISMACLDR